MHGRIVTSPSVQQQIRASDCEFFVTGASGWIGRAFLDCLYGVFGEETSDRVHVFASVARDIRLPGGQVLHCKRLTSGADTSSKPKIVLHCAFLTRDKLASQSVDDFISGNIAISDNMDALVRENDVRGFFMPSSGAVYARASRSLSDDIATNPYGVLKIRDELRFGAWASKAGVPACLPRVFNLAGPYINKPKSYALASMILSALNNGVIRIQADHIVKRSFIHIADLLDLAFSTLLAPDASDVSIFDTAGEEILEMADLAVHIRDSLGEPQIPILRPEIRRGEQDVYVGDGTEFARMLASRNISRLGTDQQIKDTAEFLRDQVKSINEGRPQEHFCAI